MSTSDQSNSEGVSDQGVTTDHLRPSIGLEDIFPIGDMGAVRLGRQVRAQMLVTKVTQEDIAVHCGCTKSTVSRRLNAKTPTSVKFWRKVEELLEVRLDWEAALLGEEALPQVEELSQFVDRSLVRHPAFEWFLKSQSFEGLLVLESGMARVDPPGCARTIIIEGHRDKLIHLHPDTSESNLQQPIRDLLDLAKLLSTF